jgi:hypothetical protein
LETFWSDIRAMQRNLPKRDARLRASQAALPRHTCRPNWIDQSCGFVNISLADLMAPIGCRVKRLD